MTNPFFTVIVVSLNAGQKIKETLQSILLQNTDDYEVVIKDGLSKDDTLSFVPYNEHIRIFSEADSSVYDGMNQAIEYSHGNYLIFMNCGDIFASEDVLNNTKDFIMKYVPNKEVVIYGDYQKDGLYYKQKTNLDSLHFIKEGLCHQTAFFHHNLFKSFGNYSKELKLCADYDLFVRLYIGNIPFVHVPYSICKYQGGGISEIPENLNIIRKESNLIRKSYFPLRMRIQYNIRRIYVLLLRKFKVK